MLRTVLIHLLSIAVIASLAFAQANADAARGAGSQEKEARKLEQQASRLDSEADHAEGTDRVFETLSGDLGVPVETLKAQKESTNFGFGQLFIANALAKASGKAFDQIAQEFKDGKGWGVIASENNVRLGKIVSEMRSSTAEMRQAHKNEMNNRRKGDARPQGVGRPEEPRGRGAAGRTPGNDIGKSRRRGQ